MRIKEKLPTPPATTGVSYRELLHQNHQEALKGINFRFVSCPRIHPLDFLKSRDFKYPNA